MVETPSLVALVLAAGKGTRMRSELPKVLHPIAGEPLIGHLLRTLNGLGVARTVAIVGHGADQVRSYLDRAAAGGRTPGDVATVVQAQQLGTGHAVLTAAPALEGFTGNVLILSGDVPLISASTLRKLQQVHVQTGSSLTLLSAIVPNPAGYGRIVRDGNSAIKCIVEEKDATVGQKQIREINAGVYMSRWTDLQEVLPHLQAGNAQGEYYLPDAVELLYGAGKRIEVHLTPDHQEIEGVNSRPQLVALAAEYQRRVAGHWLDQGVTVESPSTTWIGPWVELGEDTTVEQGSSLTGSTRVGRGCTVGAFSSLSDTRLGDGVVVRQSVLTEAQVGDGTTIGPFAHLRGGVELGKNVRVGNFMELKHTRMGDGSKAAHLSYLGDATLGKDVNVGCGTITCNYDGVRKHPTVVGDGAFIGSNSTLVAPVTIGEDAYTAAGSTITSDVPDGALGVARARQVNKEGWAFQRKGIART